MLSRSDICSVALELRAAELAGTAAANPSHRFVDLDWTDARAIALERDRLRRDDGDTPIGYKLGWTSAAMRKSLGIDRPNWGTLWTSQRLDGPLDHRRLRHAKLEPEIVYVAARCLTGPDVSAREVIAAAAGWALGIEVVHPRFASYDFTWLDNTCDNSSAMAVAVGATEMVAVDPATIDVSFDDGRIQRAGRGQAMGSPAEAVAWLVRSLAAEGASLGTGDIVFTGGLTAPFDWAVGTTYSARSALLPPVDLTGQDLETERIDPCHE